MRPHLHLDFETFSKADIKKVGAYRYAFDPSTEILCAAMALGDGEPVGWSEDQWQHIEDEYWDAMEDPEVLIYAHNAGFEMAICQALLEKTWGIPCPALSRFRCTMSLGRRAALPAKLEMLGEALNLTAKKDNRGKALIKKFSVMQPAKKPTKAHPQGLPSRRIYPQDEPEAFAEFLAYCKQDVRTEQAVAKALAYFDEPINNANYTLHEVINARGVTVNLGALEHAQKLIDEETETVSEQFRQLTGFEVTQGSVLLEWLHKKDAPLDNLQAETIEAWLSEQEEKASKRTEIEEAFEHTFGYGMAFEALRMKQSIAYASIKKVKTMLDCAGPHDNRIRGMLEHHLATTGRAGSRLVQFQNMKRSTLKESEQAYRDICAGISREMMEITYGAPLEVISSCIRHFVHDSETNFTEICYCGSMMSDHNMLLGCNSPKQMPPYTTERPLLDADYSAIEARIVNWLAGQEDALQEYRDGVDRYKVMASLIYGTPVAEINKHPQRFVGKQCILGCGFGMGPTKFRATCKKMGSYDLPVGLEETAVHAFRAKHKKVKQFWYDLENAAKKAICNKEEIFRVRHLALCCKVIGNTPFLLMRLPSGRKLAYPRPRMVNNRIQFWGNIKGAVWGFVDTWGGTLAENATQAVAADIMCGGAINAEAAGYQILALIHDQALAYYQEGQTVEEFVRLLTELPGWAEGLPIEAEGGLVAFYKKD